MDQVYNRVNSEAGPIYETVLDSAIVVPAQSPATVVYETVHETSYIAEEDISVDTNNAYIAVKRSRESGQRRERIQT